MATGVFAAVSGTGAYRERQQEGEEEWWRRRGRRLGFARGDEREEGVVERDVSQEGGPHCPREKEEDDIKIKLPRVVGLGVSWAEERLRARWAARLLFFLAPVFVETISSFCFLLKPFGAKKREQKKRSLEVLQQVQSTFSKLQNNF
jgi:hypothetical protein